MSSKKRNIKAIYPLTPMQEGMLFHSLKDPDSGVYVEQMTARLRGPLDIDAFRRAWELMVTRHSVLRTAFSWKSLDRMMQVELREVSLPMTFEDWRDLPPDEQETRFQALIRSDRAQGFNPAKAPLMRIHLIRTGEEAYRLLWSNHHILMDGWSLPIIMREVFMAYEAYNKGYQPMLPPARPFKNYIDWLQKQDVGEAEAFWRELLAGFDEPVRLRIEKRAPQGPPETREQSLKLSPDLSQALTQLARTHRVTLNTVISAAWVLTLSRYSGRRDVVYGATVSGRPTDLPGAETMVGLFINTLPMRVQVRDDQPLGDWLRGIHALQFEMRQFEYTPLVKVAEWSDIPAGSPLFETIFVFENYPVDDALRTQQTSVALEDVKSYEQTNYPLTVVAGPGEEIGVKASYDARLYDDDAIARLLGHLRNLLADMAAHPHKRVGELDLLDEEERHRLLVAWNQTARPIPDPHLIHQRFEAVVEAQPDAIAVEFGDERLTYAELNARANQLAHRLIGLGVEPGDRVALLLERSPAMPIAMLAVLKAGAAYVPIDPNYPEERIRYMIEDSAARIVISDQYSVFSVQSSESEQASELHTEHSTDVSRAEFASAPALSFQVIHLDELNTETYLTTNPNLPLTPNHPAYIIYTSGSTGKPKGVLLRHLGLVNFVDAYARRMRVESGRKFLQFASFSFDASMAEFYLALLTGATLVMGPREAMMNPDTLAELINRHGVDSAILPPTMLRALDPAAVPGLRYLFSAGEACTPDIVAVWAQDRYFGNGYGPTENTIGATYASLDPSEAEQAIVTIGRPVDNVRAYVLDDAMRPVPIGVPGELYLGGVGVALGYLNRPDLTAEKFVPDPFVSLENHEGTKARRHEEKELSKKIRENPSHLRHLRSHPERLYKTGDLVRYRPDGNIEFLDRVDFQVKVRGFRIELEEITTLLKSFDQVEDAIVLALPDDRGDNRLVAYVAPRDPALVEDDARRAELVRALREGLAQRLPDYMIPSAFLILPALPLTPSGKIDRRALLSMDITTGLADTYEPPRTPAEELLAGIWEQLLGVSRVGRNDNFFELGGHSILATQLAARIRKVFEIELPLNAVFEARTLADLAALIEKHVLAEDMAALPPIEPAPRPDGRAPLSLAQQRLWFLDQLEPGNLFYNIPTVIRLTGQLDQDALQAALDEIIRRHESLRTTFGDEDGQPVQIIHEHLPVEPDIIDLRGLSDGEREQEAARLIRETVRTPFDLAAGPLLRARLIRLADDEHIAVLVMHHIVSDGWSMGVFVNELTTLYEAFVQGRPSPLPPLRIQYADYAIWQRQHFEGEALEKQLDYWRKQLEGLPPLLELPTDRPRPPIQTSNGATYTFRLSRELTDRLEQLSRDQGVTLFMTLLAGYQTLLSRYSGMEDIAVGSAVANRSRAELEPLIGFFVNTLVFRTDLSGAPSFKELLKRVREVTLGAFAHQDVPFEKLVDALQPERNLSHTPLFQVAFALQNLPMQARELPGLTVAPVEADSATAQYDLLLMVSEDDAGLAAAMQYNTDLFDESTIARMMRHWEMLLTGAVEDPNRPVTRLPLLTPEERQTILVDWNRTEVPYPETTIHALFEEQARIRPDAEAAVFVHPDGREDVLTYAQLNARANQLAHHLIELGVQPNDIVGLSVQRSLEMVVGILGILKAGGAYLPIDPTYPPERIRYMIEDSGIGILLSQSALRKQYSVFSVQYSESEQALQLNTEHSSGASRAEFASAPALSLQVLYLDELNTEHYPATNPNLPLTADNLAYVIYTSGSTGRPKGTLLRHRGLCNLADVHHRNFEMTEGKRVLQFSPFSFDASVWETVMALRNGAALVLAPQETLASGPDLLRLIREHRITTATLPPSLLAVLDETDLPTLDTLIAAGEACSNELVKKWAPGRNFWNAYGPTETTVCASMYLIDPEQDYPQGPPIGKPISNFQLYVLDKHGEPLPVGVPGELAIGGVGLAVGYHNRPDLTAAKFVPNPFIDYQNHEDTKARRHEEEKSEKIRENPLHPRHPRSYSQRLYLTGDLVKFLPDGNIQFLGRIDHQVKVRGFRIELGEIEAVLNAHPQVVEGVVIVREERGDKMLVAYYTAGEEVPSPGELRAFMRQRLPEYMIPNIFVHLEAMPLTPSNKIDRKALPAPDQTRAVEVEYVPPSTETEIALAEIVAELLSLDRVGLNDNFFELGGHSLMATQFVSRVRETFGVELPLRTIFEHPSVGELAGEVDKLRAEQTEDLADVADLLDQLMSLSDEEVEALLEHTDEHGKHG